ncbi:MAG: aminomethyltransferase family protein [Anaerolineales bacterium]|nr:aminomethyltransferase family protein [Anaerolineales bacterium]
MYNKNVYKYDEMKRAEHNAVRQVVGWYYFTHELIEVSGADATAFLDKVFPKPIASLKTGGARYTTMLNEQGGIIDDVVVFRLDENKYWISTLYASKMKAWFDKHKSEENVAYENVTKQHDMFAVQGPKSRDLVNSIAEENVDDQKFFTIAENSIDGIPVKISRTGFSGEKLGYEIYIAPEHRAAIEAKLKATAESLGGRQVTEFQIMVLTLPAEKGFYLMRDLLYLTPLEVGLDRGIDWDKDFIGKEALLEIKEKGPAREMLGLTVDEDDVRINHKCFGGPGDPVLLDGEEIGRVSKFTYSYGLDKNIGYVLAKNGVLKAGDHVTIHGNDAVITDKIFV